MDKPKVEYKESEVYTLEEASILLKCLELESDVPHWQIIIKLAITTGMRRSELFGLEFKHIDYDNGIVHFKQALTYTKEKGYQVHEIRKGNRTFNQRDIVLSKSLITPIKNLNTFVKKKEWLLKNCGWMESTISFWQTVQGNLLTRKH
ncbi:tyrosine-type recombinase/integrase [Siminovitchia terrae]|uniref:tyrosine-type recombinase/integrase n=1 Tax=Siminovitchia terrae TaxID=1914933 RepID=UPI0035715228